MPVNQTLAQAQDKITEELRDGGSSGAIFVFGSGLVGTVTFEGTIVDSPVDADYFPVNSLLLPSGATKATTAVNPAANSAFWVPSGGALTKVRARVSAFSSGSCTVSSRASLNGFLQFA